MIFMSKSFQQSVILRRPSSYYNFLKVEAATWVELFLDENGSICLSIFTQDFRFEPYFQSPNFQEQLDNELGNSEVSVTLGYFYQCKRLFLSWTLTVSTFVAIRHTEIYLLENFFVSKETFSHLQNHERGWAKLS